jgi:Anti-sigma-K factor rskA, C-terminal
MNHEELRDHYELYAIGVAGEPERTEIREHLSRGCEVCMTEMKRARAFTSALGASAAPMAPSPQLRRRILASVGHEQRKFGWAPFLGLATALALFGVFYFSSRERQIAEQATLLREQMRRQTIELTQLNEAFAILNGPSTLEVSFGQGPKGKVYIDRSRGVLLIASNLPPAPAGKVYVLWTIAKGAGAKPVPAGLFQSDPSGAAMHLLRGPVDANLAVVAVTLENEGGAPQPTSTPLIAAALE